MANKNWGKILKTVATLGFALWKSQQSKKTNQSQPSTTVDTRTHSTSKRSTTKTGSSTPKSSTAAGKNKASSKSKNTSPKPTTSTGGQTIKPAGSSKSKTANAQSPALSDQYPGDYRGKVTAHYAPELDGDADPGEIVWTWVPYEEDFSQGKDRPVLLIGYDGDWLLGLMLTSKDHTGNGSRYGDWLDIGSGPWDNQGRDSEIRLDRVIRINPAAMRREGAIMDEKTFNNVINAM